jgi:hypothetical protein
MREKYQDAPVLSFRERRRCVSNGIVSPSNNIARHP